ncbi:hypothetical protein J3R83DRAFT_14068 [Lanmaoa asiatica]|nr:hypothetical protein J3R83DRAFT_14068 [Lanmaoa asiatica]
MATSGNPPTQRANVLVIDEKGVGKSSIINLIAGHPLSSASAGARGCTMEATPYDVVLTDSQGLSHDIRLFDTVGVNSASLSKNDYLAAIEKAHELITKLQRTGGIRLLIFCIQGDKITSFAERNHRLFCDILCQNRVPVMFALTGMENQQPMGNWWTKNAALFKLSNPLCTSHACVAVTHGLNNIYAGQQTEIHRMLLTHLSGTSWNPERTGWFIRLARELLGWVAEVRGCRRIILGQSSGLKVGELALHLEDRRDLSREVALELAGEILTRQ